MMINRKVAFITGANRGIGLETAREPWVSRCRADQQPECIDSSAGVAHGPVSPWRDLKDATHPDWNRPLTDKLTSAFIVFQTLQPGTKEE
jgi:hypothetical protein